MTPHAAYPIVAVVLLACWLVALIGYLPPVMKRFKFPLGTFFFALGWAVIIAYMAWMWIALQRPPMRTQGETRLWYTLMLPGLGLLVQWRWKTVTMAIPTIVMAAVFIILNLAHPEMMDKTLMPALQSPWFVPHVIVYMISYATFGVAAAVGLWTLVRDLFRRDGGPDRAVDEAQRLIIIGFPFLTAGLIFGALWAKVAWGNYWSWDPKETWAFLTWAIYLVYIHLKTYTRLSSRAHLALLTFGFIITLICWFGVNSLPNAQSSAHTYMN